MLAREIADDRTRSQLVAEIDGEVVGALDAELLPPHGDARYAFTRDLNAPRLRIDVPGDRRRAPAARGVGTALVQAAEAWGREHGATVAELTTYQDSPLAIRSGPGAPATRALGQPPQGALKRRGNARVVTSGCHRPKGET